MDANSRILVTGGSGMVGRALVSALKAQGYSKLMIPTSKELDCRDQDAVFSYMNKERPEFVFHLAGHIGGIKANISRPVEFLYENLSMALNVIGAARAAGVKKLANVGSSCIYPRECPQPMREEHILTGPFEPTNEGYAIAKTAAIRLCEYMNLQFKMNYFSLIPCNLYGVNDHFEAENSHVVSALMFKMHQAKIEGHNSVEVWGTGATRREFLYVDDFAEALIYFMNTFVPTSEFSHLNVGSASDQTVRELAELIKEVTGFKGTLEFNTSRPDGMPKKLMDSQRAIRLGWRARTSLADGLKKTYAWYQGTLK